MISKQVQGEILEPIILRRERDEINEGDFQFLVKSVLKLCPIQSEERHRLVDVALNMVIKDIEMPPHKRSPGAPGSIPKELDLADAIIQYLEFHPKSTLKELFNAFGEHDQDAVSLRIAELRIKGKLTNIVVYQLKEEHHNGM